MLIYFIAMSVYGYHRISPHSLVFLKPHGTTCIYVSIYLRLTTPPSVSTVGEQTAPYILYCTYFQESAMAPTGEWRDKLWYLKLTCALLDRAVRFQCSYLYSYRGYTNSGAIVSLPWYNCVVRLSRSLTLRVPQV